MIRAFSIVLVALLLGSSSLSAEELRNPAHTKYATELWDYLQKAEYQKWSPAGAIELPFGPPACHEGATFGNVSTIKTKPNYEYGSLIVTDNQAEGSEETASVTVWYRVKPGFDTKRNDWYFAVFSPEGKIIKTSADKNPHDQRGFYVQEEEGRLWVFHIHSADLAAYLADGDLPKRVTRVSAGPGGETLMSGSADEIDAFLAAASSGPAAIESTTTDDSVPAKAGFVTMIEDGRLWIFREGSEELRALKESGDLAKRVTRVSAGPNRMTVMAPDAETIDAYLAK